MERIVLASGLARRGDRLLLVASRYANRPEPLWGLPGGRQRPGELLAQTLAREVREETGLRAEVGALLYLSESLDAAGGMHVLNATFALEVTGTIQIPGEGDHVAAVEWVALDAVAARIAVAVVREPLLAHVNATLSGRYAGYPEAGITIRWPSDDA